MTPARKVVKCFDDPIVDRQQQIYEAPVDRDNGTGEHGYLGVIGHGSWEELVSKPLKLGEIAGQSRPPSTLSDLDVS